MMSSSQITNLRPMNLRRPLLLLAIICLPMAMPNARGADKSEKGIILRLLACETSKEPAKVYLQAKDFRSEVLDLPSSGFSEPIAVPTRSVELKAPDSDAPLCKIVLPAEGKSFAIVLASDHPAGFVPFVVRLDDDSFKAGDYLFINRSTKTVVLQLGSTEVIVEAGVCVKSRPTGPINDNYFNITMSDRSEVGDEIFASTRWPAENTNRGYIIFQTGSNGRTIFRSVDQSVDVATTGGKKKKS